MNSLNELLSNALLSMMQPRYRLPAPKPPRTATESAARIAAAKAKRARRAQR